MTESKPATVPAWLLAPLLALQFLTRLPIPDIGLADNRTLGRSLLWYPLVGALLGGILWLAQGLLNSLLPQLWWVQAALLLLLWVALTGGLHLDGLADSADAWAGGLGDRERTLALMKDPTCGPAAVVWLVLVLLAKAALLAALLPQVGGWLLWAPLLARAGVPALLLTTPYVRPQGLGAVLAEQLPRLPLRWLLTGLVLTSVLAGAPAWVALLLCTLLGWGLRGLMLRRIGGTTGDTLGALVELLELVAMLGLLVALSSQV